MPTFKIAHVKQQGTDLIIIPLSQDFRYKSDASKISVANELQIRASNAGLAGTVVPVWDNGGSRMAFIAPENYRPFFRSISLGWVAAHLNRELFWN